MGASCLLSVATFLHVCDVIITSEVFCEVNSCLRKVTQKLQHFFLRKCDVIVFVLEVKGRRLLIVFHVCRDVHLVAGRQVDCLVFLLAWEVVTSLPHFSQATRVHASLAGASVSDISPPLLTGRQSLATLICDVCPTFRL